MTEEEIEAEEELEVITMRREPGMTEKEWVEAKLEAREGKTLVAITTAPGIYSSCTMTLRKDKPKKAPAKKEESEEKPEPKKVKPEIEKPPEESPKEPESEEPKEAEPKEETGPWDEFLSDLYTDVIPAIQGGDYTVEQLTEMRIAEEGGRKRSTVISTIDHKIASAK